MRGFTLIAAWAALVGLAAWSVTLWDVPSAPTAQIEATDVTKPLHVSSPTVTSRRTTRDRDCRDFSTHSQAQAFFESEGLGDPHLLDGDGDGIACERLP
ncbi:excalibur calcium-binding domain-containing protein [Terricaulis silvestris]|uniref:excalibur calcium-binding domain-containing protein n=1 Tax=Terricaulis silvestris TaxID=2686094 RepID=UPI003899FB92